MRVSRLDILYRKFLVSKFFTKGWGDPRHIMQLLNARKTVSKRESCYPLVDAQHPIEILKEETWSDCYVTEGRFHSPFAQWLPDVVVPEVASAHFQMLVPKSWSRSQQKHRPMCIHMAGTGDHGYWKRRQLMAKPLLKHGIGSIILENPFYGYRKPRSQVRSCLLHVSDIFVMGGCIILECIALMHFCERLGYGPLGLTGLSMGGHMASLAACNWPKPVVLVPCLSWSTASAVFTEGVMSEAIDWDHLQEQFLSDKAFYETISQSCAIVDDPRDFGLARIPEFAMTLTLLASHYNKCAYGNLTPHQIVNLISSTQQSNDSADNKSESIEMTTTLNRKLFDGAFAGSLVKSLLWQSAQLVKVRDQNAIWFMRGLMDECTHLRNFTTPVDTSLITAIAANCDAYVPKDGCSRLEDIWPGATVRHLNTGHVGAYIRYLDVFRESIVEAFKRAMALKDEADEELKRRQNAAIFAESLTSCGDGNNNTSNFNA